MISNAKSGDVSIRLATVQDATELSALAARLFKETFEPYTALHDMAVYLASTYSPDRQAVEIADANGTVLVAEDKTLQERQALVGYAYLSHSPIPESVTGPAPLELKRFYVDSPWHGQGVAHVLMAEVLRYAVVQGARTLWLGVYEHNARAYAFYRKYGFQRVGEHVFPVGADPQIDWLLARSLDTLTSVIPPGNKGAEK